MKRALLLSYTCILISLQVFGQRPSLQPKSGGDPVDFTNPKNIILYIVIPIVIVILYFLYKREQKKDNTDA
ncbi:MAG: hypothetical protein LAT76_03995 [Schleiferiaceae bacterium]|nr:hypothetical protein [Schleiferiaceae bacterium]